MGWRLPSMVELSSLVDPPVVGPTPPPTNTTTPPTPLPVLPLPQGHPFLNVQLALYWSATASALGSEFAWAVPMISGFGVQDTFKVGSFWFWCVRGGMNADTY